MAAAQAGVRTSNNLAYSGYKAKQMSKYAATGTVLSGLGSAGMTYASVKGSQTPKTTPAPTAEKK